MRSLRSRSLTSAGSSCTSPTALPFVAVASVFAFIRVFSPTTRGAPHPPTKTDAQSEATWAHIVRRASAHVSAQLWNCARKHTSLRRTAPVLLEGSGALRITLGTGQRTGRPPRTLGPTRLTRARALRTVRTALTHQAPHGSAQRDTCGRWSGGRRETLSRFFVGWRSCLLMLCRG